VSPAEQPGQSDHKPADPSDVVSDADVEKTLGQLESMTSTLAKEVGTPAKKAGGDAPAKASPPVEPTGESEAPAVPAEADAQAPAVAAEQAEAVRAEEAAAPESVEQTHAAGGPAASQATGAVAASTGQDAPAAEPADGGRTAAQAEIDQEINQALQQLQQGGGAAPARPPESPAVPKPAREPRRLGRLVLRGLDTLLAPLAVVFVLLDLPFRRLPGVVRQLLGYVAMGTALMAAALWVYILTSRGQ